MPIDTPALRRILTQHRTIAVVGLSADWNRPSYFAAKYMQSHGYRIVPVNPRYAGDASGILGETCYGTLSDIPFAIDMVDVFRPKEEFYGFAEKAIAIGAKVLWGQIGVYDDKAARLAQDAGLQVVMNRCPKIELFRPFWKPRLDLEI